MKEFFKMLLASLIALALVLGGLLVGFFIFVAALSSGKEGTVTSGAMLVLNFDRPISDKPSSSDPNQVVMDALGGGGAKTYTLREVTDAIEYAAKDDRIKGIYLTGGVAKKGYLSGWGALREIRQNLVEFRKTGKRIVAWNDSHDESTFYLASVADEILVDPLGISEFNGFAANILFYAKALDKLGIGVQVTRVGKYKSAVEPFILEHISEANREQITKLLNDIWGAFLGDISKSRKLSVADLQQIADAGGLVRGDKMVQMKLADRTASFDQLLDELKQFTGAKADERTFKQVGLEHYLKAIEGKVPHRSGKGKIAVIYAEGDIVDGESRSQVGGNTVARLLRQARLDNDVKAVVLRVNSPGGSATASEVIQRETRLLNKNKPVVVSMGTVAASGGYWISTYGKRIFAEPATLTGSIGVFGMLPNIEKLSQTIGVNSDVVKTGKYADLNNWWRARGPEELDVIQQEVNFIYDAFISKVSEGRKLPAEKVREIAQGRVWSGVEAKNLGLVDELGGLEEAIAYAGKATGLGDNYELVSYQEKRPAVQQFLESLAGEKPDQSEAAVLLQRARILTDQFGKLAQLNDPKGVYARLPFDVETR